MALDIPANIAPDIRKYARSQHITEDQAVARLLKAGLESTRSQSRRSIIGAFAGTEESAVMDGALELAMRDRERRNSKI